jgi:hypothetical protein
MNPMDPRQSNDETPTSADGITERNPAIPASEEGTGMVPGDGGSDEGEGDGGTHLPASEADTSFAEEAQDELPQSWPGSGGPGTIPPPG